MRRRRRGRWRRVLALALAIAGAAQLASGGWIHAKAILAQVLLQAAWARTAEAGEGHRAWPWADTWPVARLRVPGHGVDLIVLDGASGEALAFGPGRLRERGTTGERPSRHTVISGHRDTHFAFVRRLGPGDRIELEAPGGHAVAYVVTGRLVLDFRAPLPGAGDLAPVLSLVTCYPFDAIVPGGPLRYVVTARAT